MNMLHDEIEKKSTHITIKKHDLSPQDTVLLSLSLLVYLLIQIR